MHIIILGAGPAGLSAALSLSQLAESCPPGDAVDALRVTILELRPKPTTLGGSINLTPLGLRYLSRYGVSTNLGIPVDRIDVVSLRTGRVLGSRWSGAGGRRLRRLDLVTAMLETIQDPTGPHLKTICVRFGIQVVKILEEGSSLGKGRIRLELEDGVLVEGDVLLGCDGLHSAARRLFVEPGRTEEYSGKAVAYAFTTTQEPGLVKVLRADAQPAVRDTTVVSGRRGQLLLSYCDAARDEVYIGAVMNIKDEQDGRESRAGWKARAEDKAEVKENISSRFLGGKLHGLIDLVDRVDDWCLYPVYILPNGGRWSKGRVLLLGDAAHAMAPQGESTGISIEDGALIGHVFQRYTSRSIPELFSDYESLRRPTINKLYVEAYWRWHYTPGGDIGWFRAMLLEWLTIGLLWLSSWRQQDDFARDVKSFKLPP